jgi:hypothetical protein
MDGLNENEEELSKEEFNRRIIETVDALLCEAGYSSESSARNLLSMLNL